MGNNEYILFYDSGIGGINTLKEARKMLPKERFLYYADDKNCPYGNRSAQEIENIVKQRLKWLLKRFNIKLVVFACNTITTCCVEHLRTLYGFDIVGTEPAVLPAMRQSKNKEVLVIATKATLEQLKYKKLINKIEGKVYSYVFENLAGEIEKHKLGEREIDIDGYIGRIKVVLNEHKRIDSLVLGCTHYCYLREVFQSALNVQIFDGNDGVAKRVVSLLVSKNRMSDVDYGANVRVVLSSGDKNRIKKYEKLIESEMWNG